MEDREHLFNRTSMKIEKRVEKLYFDAFDLLTDKGFLEEYTEKEFDLLSNLIDYNNDMLFSLMKEKVYEFCLKNKDNVMTYDDDGIVIKDKDSETGVPVTSVFVELYKYMEYVQHAYQYSAVCFNKPDIDPQTIKSVFASTDEHECLSTDQIDIILKAFSRLVLELIPDDFNYDYEFVCTAEKAIKGYSDIQQYVIHVYLETICHVFNNIRRNPEIFKDQLGITLDDLYSKRFIYTAFITRDNIVPTYFDFKDDCRIRKNNAKRDIVSTK